MFTKKNQMEMIKQQGIFTTHVGVDKKGSGGSGRREQWQIQDAIVKMANFNIQKSYCQYQCKDELCKVSNSTNWAQNKSKYVVKYKKSIKMEDKYLDQIMLNKLYMIENIINVDNQYTKQLPISLHISINKHKNKTKKQPRYKYGKKKKDYTDPLPDPPPTLLLSYCQLVVADRPAIQNQNQNQNQKVFQNVFEKMVDQIHGYVMEQIQEMEISMQLNRFTDRMLQKIKQIAMRSKNQVEYRQKIRNKQVKNHNINQMQDLLNIQQLIN